MVKGKTNKKQEKVAHKIEEELSDREKKRKPMNRIGNMFMIIGAILMSYGIYKLLS